LQPRFSAPEAAAMALRPTAVHDIAQDILGCVCAAMTDAAAEVDDYPGCPCRHCVVPGTPAWDSCEDPCTGEVGGQLTVNLARMWPSSDFPREDRRVLGLRGRPPAPPTAVELVVTVLRCAPYPDAGGCPPSCEELEAAARTVHIDAAVVHNALLCCLPHTAPGRRGRRFVLEPARTIGPQGGCVGIEQRVTVALPGCGCPDGGTFLCASGWRSTGRAWSASCACRVAWWSGICGGVPSGSQTGLGCWRRAAWPGRSPPATRGRAAV